MLSSFCCPNKSSADENIRQNIQHPQRFPPLHKMFSPPAEKQIRSRRLFNSESFSVNIGTRSRMVDWKVEVRVLFLLFPFLRTSQKFFLLQVVSREKSKVAGAAKLAQSSVSSSSHAQSSRGLFQWQFRFIVQFTILGNKWKKMQKLEKFVLPFVLLSMVAIKAG